MQVLRAICSNPDWVTVCHQLAAILVSSKLSPSVVNWHDFGAGLARYCHSMIGQAQRWFSPTFGTNLSTTFVKDMLVTGPMFGVTYFLKFGQLAGSPAMLGRTLASDALRGANYGLIGQGFFADMECKLSGNN
jgi:hypothetical protein